MDLAPDEAADGDLGAAPRRPVGHGGRLVVGAPEAQAPAHRVKDPTAALDRIVRALVGTRPRNEKLQEVAEILRSAGPYRFVGISEATCSPPPESRRAASEIRVPILDIVKGEPRGAIEVESGGESLGDEDRESLEHAAAEIGAALSASPG